MFGLPIGQGKTVAGSGDGAADATWIRVDHRTSLLADEHEPVALVLGVPLTDHSQLDALDDEPSILRRAPVRRLFRRMPSPDLRGT